MFVLTILVIIAGVLLVNTAIIIPARQTGIMERLGRFERVLEPGLHFLIPFFDRVAYRQEMREQVIEVPAQSCISRDNIQIEVDGNVYLKVLDPRLASYGIENYRLASINLAQTTMRAEIGKLDLHQAFSERDSLNLRVVEEIDKAASFSWGVKVLRYEIMNIIPSAGVEHALEKAMEAERDRRAEVTLATAEKEALAYVSEGTRQESINLSEGARQKQINLAEGRAEAIIMVASATAQGIERVGQSLSQLGGMDAMQMRIVEGYIEEFGKVLKTAEVTVAPESLANIKGFFTGLESVMDVSNQGARK